MGLFDYARLARAGLVLAREGAFSLIDPRKLDGPARFGLWALRRIERRAVRKTGRVERLSRALNRLGPTYVKFGQSLATRPDIVGPEIAEDLSKLQDSMDPFDAKLVPGILEKAFGERAAQITELSAPIAAASIAQVHKAVLISETGEKRAVALKILRPGVRTHFHADLKSYAAGARLGERMIMDMQRLKPGEVVDTLKHSARMELDLRFEAAAISKFAENEGPTGFATPDIVWDLVTDNVLTTSWVDAIPVRDTEALDAAGLDRSKLAADLLQGFLRQAIGRGFFHADMHPGNLFADPESGRIVAVDFGIVGHLNRAERSFLAEMLYGFIKRDYDLIARRHFEIGYVPQSQSVEDFALAIRAIGEPLSGRVAADISIGKMLGQLFEITEIFNMATRPELILLQKTMVMAEGVARMLDPELNIWEVAEPVLGPFVEREKGPLGQFERLRAHGETAIETLGQLPELVARANTVLSDFDADLRARRASRWPWLFPGVLAFLAALVLILVFKA